MTVYLRARNDIKRSESLIVFALRARDNWGIILQDERYSFLRHTAFNPKFPKKPNPLFLPLFHWLTSPLKAFYWPWTQQQEGISSSYHFSALLLRQIQFRCVSASATNGTSVDEVHSALIGEYVVQAPSWLKWEHLGCPHVQLLGRLGVDAWWIRGQSRWLWLSQVMGSQFKVQLRGHSTLTPLC